jgi:hypothetical protein
MQRMAWEDSANATTAVMWPCRGKRARALWGTGVQVFELWHEQGRFQGVEPAGRWLDAWLWGDDPTLVIRGALQQSCWMSRPWGTWLRSWSRLQIALHWIEASREGRPLLRVGTLNVAGASKNGDECANSLLLPRSAVNWRRIKRSGLHSRTSASATMSVGCPAVRTALPAGARGRPSSSRKEVSSSLAVTSVAGALRIVQRRLHVNHQTCQFANEGGLRGQMQNWKWLVGVIHGEKISSIIFHYFQTNTLVNFVKPHFSYVF